MLLANISLVKKKCSQKQKSALKRCKEHESQKCNKNIETGFTLMSCKTCKQLNLLLIIELLQFYHIKSNYAYVKYVRVHYSINYYSLIQQNTIKVYNLKSLKLYTFVICVIYFYISEWPF